MNKKFFLINLVCLFLVSFLVKAENSNSKMKLYSFYTPTHKILKDEHFLPTLQDDYEVIIEFYDEKAGCPSGEYGTLGFNQTVLKKADLMIRAIRENWGKVFVYADVDIQFFSSVEQLILKAVENHDMAFQIEKLKSGSSLKDCINGDLSQAKNDPNTGFIVCKGNERTLFFWKTVKE